MQTVVISKGFSAYVGKTLREFTPGEEVDVADDLAANVIEKGLAREKPGEIPKPVAKVHKETPK